MFQNRVIRPSLTPALPEARRTLSPRVAAIAMMLTLVSGLFLRVWHLPRNPVVWGDEGAALINIIEKNYAQAAGPLRLHQAIPPLFLMAEHAMGQLLGPSEYAFRLLPLLASCAMLLLLAWAAWRVMPGFGAVVAAGLLALSDRMLWHATEAKQYSLEALWAAAAVAWFVQTRRRPMGVRAGVAMAAMPLAIWSSYAAVFVIAGLWVALAVDAVRARERRAWAWLGLGALVAAGALVPLLLGPVHAQKDANIMTWWRDRDYFFPAAHPWEGPGWALKSTTALFDFLLRPAGVVLLVPALAGIVHWWRRDQGLLALTVVPLVLAFGLACVGAYPYGGARVMMFALPGLALLVGQGAGAWKRGRTASAGSWGPAASWLCGGLALGALASALVLDGIRVAVPWPRPDTRGSAAYVLRHRAADETVVARDSSFAYYLRGLGGRYRDTLDGSDSGRVWVITTSASHSVPLDGWEPDGPPQLFQQARVQAYAKVDR